MKSIFFARKLKSLMNAIFHVIADCHDYTTKNFQNE